MTKWTAICVIGVVTAISSAIAVGSATDNSGNTTTITCPVGTHGSAGTLNGQIVVVCSSK